jgi:hypothetical protein
MNSATQSVLRFSGSPGEDWRTAHVSCRSVVLSPFRGRTNCQLTAEGGIQNCGGAREHRTASRLPAGGSEATRNPHVGPRFLAGVVLY